MFDDNRMQDQDVAVHDERDERKSSAQRKSPGSGKTGKVKWFNVTKGYGFIAPDNGGDDVFVHITSVNEARLTTLNEGQPVYYELKAGRGGKTSATNLRLL